jgi:hypothetical protein
MGEWQDKDGDDKWVWYPSFEGEKPPKGSDRESTELAKDDVATKSKDADSDPLEGLSSDARAIIAAMGIGKGTTTISSVGEITAEINEAFGTMFGAAVPKEINTAFFNELRALQTSRSTKPLPKGKDAKPDAPNVVVEGVDPQERKNILNKYLKQYATDQLTAVALGDQKAIANITKGTFGLTYTTLKNAYANNGIPININELGKLSVESALNPKIEQSNINLINLQAKTYYPALADKIDKGFTVKQLLTPYLNTYANILEVDADSIDLKELQDVARDPKGLMGLYDYEISLRKNPKWRFTKNAQDQLGALGRDFTKMLGVAG